MLPHSPLSSSRCHRYSVKLVDDGALDHAGQQAAEEHASGLCFIARTDHLQAVVVFAAPLDLSGPYLYLILRRGHGVMVAPQPSKLVFSVSSAFI